MNSKSVFEKLEFIKVLTYIYNYCITEKGKNKILSISPLINLPEIIKEGELITEAKEILTKHANPPIDYIQDLENILIQSTIEGALLESKKILEILKLSIISPNLF